MCVNQYSVYLVLHHASIASGQLGSNASVHVWDAVTKKSLSILRGFHTGGVCSVNFSASGRMLLSVGLDDQHSVAVWRWQEGKELLDFSFSLFLVGVKQKHV